MPNSVHLQKPQYPSWGGDPTPSWHTPGGQHCSHIEFQDRLTTSIGTELEAKLSNQPSSFDVSRPSCIQRKGYYIFRIRWFQTI